MEFQKAFEETVERIVSQTTRQTAYFFRGFLPQQVEFLIQHPASLLPENRFLENGFLQIDVLEQQRRKLLQSLMMADQAVVGFYEELIAISQAVPDIRNIFEGEVVVIDNPLFPSDVPCCLSRENAIRLFDYIQSEQSKEDPLLEQLNRYYSSVTLLDEDHCLAAPVNVFRDRGYTYRTLWQAPDGVQPAEASGLGRAREITEGSQEDWMFRLNVMKGKGAPLVYRIDAQAPRGLEGGLACVLHQLRIPYRVEKTDVGAPETVYEAARFEKELKKYWGEGASFRQLKFYKQPNISKETVMISQGSLVSEIIHQCEMAGQGDRSYRDIFITAPTGAGKSLLFQLPALYLAEKYRMLTLVITPLVALMHDQVSKLEQERGVSNATYLNSTISFEERQQRIEEIHSGKKSILYLAPELLLSAGIRPLIGQRKIGLMVIDEAHTVTSWGRDFRPDYCFLGDFLRGVKGIGQTFPVLCLTATAVYSGPDDVVNDTIGELGLHNPIRHIGDVKREDIRFDIRPGQLDGRGTRVETLKKELVLKQLLEYTQKGEKTIVYCPYITQVDELYNALPDGQKRWIRRYHAKMHEGERKITEQDYREGGVLALICTKAFGMGIDVEDIKHIIHFAPSGSLSDYVQEIGRAARKPGMIGYAHTDFFSSDLRYVKSLNALSEMKQYQLREMLKKLDNIYSSKKHRNLLVAPDSFAYLFGDKKEDLDNRTKSGLILLAKDLKNKYGGIPILLIRPKAMLAKNYVNVPPEIEGEFLKRFGQYAQMLGNVSDRMETSRKPAYGSDVRIINHGHIYAVQMGDLWENHFANSTFGAFKRKFFDGELMEGRDGSRLSPRVRVAVRYALPFEEITQKMASLLEAMERIFAGFKRGEKHTFDEHIFREKLKDALPELGLTQIQTNLILDMLTLNVDRNAVYTESRKSVRVLQKRKQKAKDASEYLVGNYYMNLKDYMLKYLFQCRPNEENGYQSFVPMGQEHTISILPVLKLMQILGFASYELRGGEQAEIFIRINDPEKIHLLAHSNYSNNVLREIVERHRKSRNLLFDFFTRPLDDASRWELIEDYFLGRLEEVEGILSARASSLR